MNRMQRRAASRHSKATGRACGWLRVGVTAGLSMLAVPQATVGAGFDDYTSSVLTESRVDSAVAADGPMLGEVVPGNAGDASSTPALAGPYEGFGQPAMPVSAGATGYGQSHPGLFTSWYTNFRQSHANPFENGPSESGVVNRVLGEACPRWVVQADALFLWQYTPGDRPLYFNAQEAPALTTQQIQPTVGIGPRIGLFLNRTDCSAIEANYFTVQSMVASTGLPVTGDGSQYSMNNLAGGTFADIDSATVTTSSSIQSFELNLREWNRGAFTWLVGVRWVEWNESMAIQDNFTDSTQFSGIDNVNVRTNNDLYGAQIGGDVLLWNTQQIVRFNAIGKAGIYGNATANQRTTTASDRPGDSPLDVSDSANAVAFFGEVGIVGSVKLTEWLAWRTGYNFFWLSGVAVPAAQLSLTDPSTNPPTTAVNSKGSVLLHGVNTGLEARW